MFRRALLLSFVVIGLFGCSAQPPTAPPINYDPHTLRVFSTYPGFSYLPFYSWTEGNRPIGFEPELAELVAEQLRMKIAFVYPREAAKQDPRVYALDNGIADAALFTFPSTKRTRKLAGLSKPYASDGISALVAANSPIATTRDLQQKKLLAFKYTSANSWASRRFPGASILSEYPGDNDSNVVDLLENDIIDAFLMGRKHLEWVAKKSNKVKVLPEQRSYEQFSIAVQKRNVKLLHRIDRALATLEANGKLDRLRQKWFVSTRER